MNLPPKMLENNDIITLVQSMMCNYYYRSTVMPEEVQQCSFSNNYPTTQRRMFLLSVIRG